MPRMPSLVCPYCTARVIAALTNHPAGALPEPGTLMVCSNCAGYGIIETDGTWRVPTLDEETRLLSNPTTFAAINAVDRLVSQRRHGFDR